MTYRSVKRATGTTLALAASSALLLTALAGPASATPANHENTLKLKVCKEVDDGHGHGRVASHHDEEFDFTVKTDEDREEFTLEDGDCERLRLKFDDNKVTLKEEDADDYDVSFDVSGDEEKVRERGDKVTVWFDEDEDRPSIRIDVTNEREHDHH